MAGIFGFFDYTKPGPGVEKDAPPKAPILMFFEILQRKFWNILKINFMFNLFNIPAIIVGMFISFFIFGQIKIPGVANDESLLISDLLIRFLFTSILTCIPMITVGPAQAGFTYILRNYSREEHAFVWSDFKDNALKNFKQSMIISGINLVITVLILLSIRAYLLIGGSNFLFTIGTTLMFILFVIFAMMNLYIYPILVTFKLSVKQIYKNSLLFAVAKLLPNLGIVLLCIFIQLLTLGMIIPFNSLIGVLLYFLITVSFIGFITNFYAYPKLKKYMIREEEVEEETEEETEEE